MVGRVFLTLFGLVFFGVGLVALWGIGAQSVDLVASRGWPSVPCRVVDSTLSTSGGGEANHRVEVDFRYEVDGVAYSGERVSLMYDGSSEVADAQRDAHRFEPGSTHECRVDPDDPERAVLRTDPLVALLWILFPIPFVGVGAFCIAMAWWPGGPSEAATAVSSRGSASMLGGKGCLALFFFVFFAAGVGVAVPIGLWPAYQVWQSRAWVETPCVIDEIYVESHSGDDSTTYSIGVLFRYEVDGRELRGDRFDFSTGSDGSRRSKQEVVDRYERGQTAACFVNPEDPYEAVVEREIGIRWYFLLFPLPFVLVGAGGIGFVLFGGGGSTAPEPSWRPDAGGAQTPSGGRVLEPEWSRTGKLIGITLVALVWNGIVAIPLAMTISEWRAGGEIDGCLVVFLVPFALIGLLLLIGVPYQLLASFNPRPVLELMPAELSLGGSGSLRWRFEGRTGRISRLKISLIAEESASYRVGTSSRTDTHPLHQLVLVDRAGGQAVQRGEATIEIPSDTMHSFEASSNQVTWKLSLHGEIRMWPDVSDEFEIVVLPPGGAW